MYGVDAKYYERPVCIESLTNGIVLLYTQNMYVAGHLKRKAYGYRRMGGTTFFHIVPIITIV